MYSKQDAADTNGIRTAVAKILERGYMDNKKYIKIRGARENNLKGIDIDIPRDEFVVLTGLSGSGKSSLAFDTIYAEGQRRYMESLSSYARMFLGQMEKPDVDSIEGLPPAISIDQKSTNKNPRSTVGTVTEIYDYFRLLYARTGIPHCPKCGKEVKRQSVDEMVDDILSYPERTKFAILAPVVKGRKGEHVKVLEQARKSGYVRVFIDGNMYELSEDIKLEKNIKHNISIVVDRLVVKPGINSRLTDSVENALKLTDGQLVVDFIDLNEEKTYSQNFACTDCGISISELEPRLFSFNNPFGACPCCHGIGIKMEFDPNLMIPDKKKSINEGAICVMGWQSSKDAGSFSNALLRALSEEYGFSLDTPYCDLSNEIQNMLLNGTDGREVKVHYKGQRGVGVYDVAFEGLLQNTARRYRESSQTMKAEYENYMSITPCAECNGKRLKPEALAVTVAEKNISELTEMSIEDLKDFMENLKLTPVQEQIGRLILKEIRGRLKFLNDVGLSYLTLARSTSSLSGGEAQRIRLATQIGSGLVGVAYILDEPSIGLHQRDNDKLLASLKGLKELGNTLIVVEHDEDTMFAADHIVDIGPGAGTHGGYLVAQGTAEDIMNCRESITGDYLSRRKFVPCRESYRTPSGFIEVKGAREHNLKNIDVKIPLGVMTCVTGVSGSGKSSLVTEIVYKTLEKELNRARLCVPGDHDTILGIEQLDKVINIDQSPIGRTPRSNPATYTGVFDMIRDLFANTSDAKMKGYGKGRFSFNIKGGRCEACSGDGINKIEMNFLPDVYVTCEVCGGKRYNRETLEVLYKGKSIFDVLDMTVEEALNFFENVPKIRNKIQTLYDVGLSYLKLGHPSTLLSGGEAQRIKLATELSRKSTGRTIYILDEPTTGLHFADVHKLVDILQRFTDGGNTVLVIEHNLDVIKTADYIIDIGPEGGDRGGNVVATGTPDEVAKCEYSYTGKYLKKVLDEGRNLKKR